MTKKFDKLYENIMEGNYPPGMSGRDMAHVKGEGSSDENIDWEPYELVEDFDGYRVVELRGNDGKYEYTKTVVEVKPYGQGNYTKEVKEMEAIGSVEGI